MPAWSCREVFAAATEEVGGGSVCLWYSGQQRTRKLQVNSPQVNSESCSSPNAVRVTTAQGGKRLRGAVGRGIQSLHHTWTRAKLRVSVLNVSGQMSPSTEEGGIGRCSVLLLLCELDP